MGGEHRVGTGVVELHRVVVLADLVADGGFQHQVLTRLQPEAQQIVHGARRPALGGDPRDRDKAHAGQAAGQFQQGRQRR